jgi:hypothetical protein
MNRIWGDKRPPLREVLLSADAVALDGPVSSPGNVSFDALARAIQTAQNDVVRCETEAASAKRRLDEARKAFADAVLVSLGMRVS